MVYYSGSGTYSSGHSLNGRSYSGDTKAAPAIDLPPVTVQRWVIRQKARVVAAVQHGLITLDDACGRYNLTVEEFLSWQKMLDKTPNWEKKYL